MPPVPKKHISKERGGKLQTQPDTCIRKHEPIQGSQKRKPSALHVGKGARRQGGPELSTGHVEDLSRLGSSSHRVSGSSSSTPQQLQQHTTTATGSCWAQVESSEGVSLLAERAACTQQIAERAMHASHVCRCGF
eukprot:1158745-Pelagomonas_calceolata.AAC.5